MSWRAAALLPVLACAALLGFGYYLQYGPRGLDPCPLCLVQRGFFYAVGGVFLLAALHGRGRALYGSLAALFAAGGFAVAARQVWLQHLPPEQVPACGPGLDFMLEVFPFTETLKMVFTGSGECAEVDWTFLGLSIAEWSLAWFVLFGIATVLHLMGKLRINN